MSAKEPLENVLNKVLRKQGLTYEIKDEHIIIYKAEGEQRRSMAVISNKIRKLAGL